MSKFFWWFGLPIRFTLFLIALVFLGLVCLLAPGETHLVTELWNEMVMSKETNK